MIVRLVELQFIPEKRAWAYDRLYEIAPKVRSFEGCSFLEIGKSLKGNGSLVITYSYWESADHLNKYRDSQLFREFWADIKTAFAEPARAWSFERMEYLD